MVSKVEWLQMEQTQGLMASLQTSIQDLQTQLGEGSTLAESADQTAMATARFTGYIYALNLVLNELLALPEDKEEAEELKAREEDAEEGRNEFSEEYSDDA